MGGASICGGFGELGNDILNVASAVIPSVSVVAVISLFALSSLCGKVLHTYSSKILSFCVYFVPINPTLKGRNESM
jgi:hypothetical protein